MAAMLRDSVVVVVVRTRPRVIPLAMIAIRKSFMGFLFFPVMTMGLRYKLVIVLTKVVFYWDQLFQPQPVWVDTVDSSQ